MPGLTDILHTARDALTAQSFGLGVAGQNVANVNTPGYVRRQADIQSQPLGSNSFGSVVAKGIIRVADHYIEQRHYSALSNSSMATESDSLLGQVESVFDVQDGANAGMALTELYSAFSELTTDPSNRALRSQVIGKAQLFAGQVESTAQAIASLRTNLTQQASSTADSVNQIAKSISDVTRKIHAADAAGYDAADLKDQRDSMLQDLSELVDVRTFTNESGQLVVQASGTTLVEGDSYRTLEVKLDT
jgi:flagellar hook-associated protein 1